MIIDIQELIDYIKCPVIYKLKKLNMYTPYISAHDKYNNDIHSFTYAYNALLSSNGSVNYDDVKQIFGSIYLGSKTQEDFIIVETGDSRDTLSTLRKKGTTNTLDFHEYNISNTYIPISIRYRYNVSISNITLTGTIDLIRQKDEEVHIINYIANSYNATGSLNNIETLAMVYAFRKIFKTKEDKAIIYLFDKNKELILDINKLQIKKLILNVINVSKAIRNNIIYFNSSDKCNSCAYYSICSNSKNLDLIFKKEV